MRDYLNIGPVPADEPCEQLGENYRPTVAWSECLTFIAQLRRTFGPEVGSAQLKVMSNQHDFGTYYEVVCWFQTNDEDGKRYAFNVEANMPLEWDKQAKEQLKAIYHETTT